VQKRPFSALRRIEILDALGVTLAESRKEAIDGRASSGIEKEWREDEEFYQGFDDANRHEHAGSASSSKPTEAGRSTGLSEEEKKSKGSTVFPNITQPYVDAAAARVGDMLLPTDDRNYAFDPTPIPSLSALDEALPKLGEPVKPPPGVDPAAAMAIPPPPTMAPGGAAMPMPPMGGPPGMPPSGAMPPGMQPPQPKTPLEQALEKARIAVDKAQKSARESANMAQKQVDDWLAECQYHAELRKAIDDAARIGSGVMKGPVPVTRKSKKWQLDKVTGEYTMVLKEEIKPASFRVDPWNLFPDPACGETIHNGAFVWERDFLTAKRLQDLKGGKGKAAYIDSQIDAVIKEGPAKRNENDARRNVTDKKDLFEVWYFHGSVKGEDLEAAGCDGEELDPEKLYPVKVTMVNDRVIKAALNPLDSGEFPYDVLPWKQRPGMPWGQGIAREGRTPQRIVVAATRNMMDNAGASARPHKVMTDDIEQDGDPWTWRIASDASIADASKAMMFFLQPSQQGELMNIINWGLTMMERVTGMPMILMGLQGDVEETAQGRNIQNNNGNSVLRRIARLFDSKITEPHMRRYYAWLMEYSENEAAKGDFQIVARGSAALVERDIQNQALPQVMQMAMNPAAEMSIKKTRDELLKSWRFDPRAFDMTEDEKAARASQPPPVAPAVQAAQIREQGAKERTQMQEQAETQRTQMKLASAEKISDGEQAIDRMVAEIDAQLGAANLSAEERIAVNDAKVTLSGLVMKLREQRVLSASKGPQLVTPPTEPAGRAPAGEAYAA
jgi:hypothetical protein